MPGEESEGGLKRIGLLVLVLIVRFAFEFCPQLVDRDSRRATQAALVQPQKTSAGCSFVHVCGRRDISESLQTESAVPNLQRSKDHPQLG
jgi:hypothetical protein